MLLFPYDFILCMSTNNWLFVNIFMNGIPYLFILIIYVDVTICMTFQYAMLHVKTIWPHLSVL
jgi:hypothetical protein